MAYHRKEVTKMTKDEYKNFIDMAKKMSNVCYDRNTCLDCPFSYNDGSSRCIFDGYPWEWSLDMTKEWKQVEEEL